MLRLFDRPVEEDLLPFSAFLWRQRVPHKITEEGGRQVLWLEHPAQEDEVLTWFAQWQSGLLQLSKVKVSWKGAGGFLSGPLADWMRIPVTLLLIVASLVVAFLTGLGNNYETVAWFSMSEYLVQGDKIRYLPLSAMYEHGDFSWLFSWRVITPIFLHFGVFHLVFNMLWLLDLGHRIELRHKGLFLALLVLFTGAVSNIVQFVSADGFPLFGGMSGVIFGLLGFCWIRERFEPGCYKVPSGIYMFMMAWLLIGFTGILGSLGLGQIANGAHAGGLLSGVAFGYLYNRFFVRSAI
ncbi:rhomboid family intramembrane serine protease [Parendozoicomonas haliclonae]|uniref:Rhomboid protease GlpG n=1 Tax=Parendozoicomonas haliclonae TaxID=1960125 RepID=A0A1X7AMQ8_9GAMM|nr:rhomboid family intramembrane serine protease [Parendozoicomonas haliclonae]SMA49276.1 Rhomboid protease GlpG [Parendozoicomonas haliclonae]